MDFLRNYGPVLLIALSTLALGFLAFYVTFYPPSETKKRRWLIAFIVLAVVALIATVRLQVISDQDREKLNHLITESNERIKELQSDLKRFLASGEPSKASPGTLKERASALSSDILRFLAERNAGEPGLPKPGTWQVDVEAIINYSKRTMDLYSQRFASRVIAIRHELFANGLRDKELDSFYEHPTNPVVIRIVGERLGALAESLTLVQ